MTEAWWDDRGRQLAMLDDDKVGKGNKNKDTVKTEMDACDVSPIQYSPNQDDPEERLHSNKKPVHDQKLLEQGKCYLEANREEKSSPFSSRRRRSVEEQSKHSKY